MVLARAPSTTRAPPVTVDVPPEGHAVLVQSVGRPGPANSAEPSAFPSCTSPSSTTVMVVFASGVPRVKSACVVSVKVPATDVMTKSPGRGDRATFRQVSRATLSAGPAPGVSRLPLSSTARERMA